jgi:hypothetical protein
MRSSVVIRPPTGATPTDESDICGHQCSHFSTYRPSLDQIYNDTYPLQAAIGVSASYDALVDLFECIANFLRRLHIYTEKIPMSPAMSDMTLKIMVEILSVLALATKQINQGRFSKQPLCAGFSWLSIV